MIALRLTFFACAVIAAMPALAQPQITSAIETGWISNALGSAGENDDAYLTQSHTIALVGGDETIALRAAITFEDTRYLAFYRENDFRARIEIAPEIALSDTARLRGRFALVYGEEGTQLTPGLGAREQTLAGSAALRYETRVGDGIWGLDLGYEAGRPHLTHIEADLVPPARASAQTDSVNAGIDFAFPLSETMALLAAAQWQSLAVPPDDQTQFGRLPLHHLRLAAGGEIADGAGSAFTLRGGVDALFPAIDGLDTFWRAYGEAQVRIAISPHLALRGSLLMGADIADPADGYADALVSGRAGLIVTPAEGWELDFGPFAKTRASIALATSIERQLGFEAALTRSWARYSLALRLSHSTVTGLNPSYDETRLGLRVAVSL